MTQPLLRDVITIPERISASDLVLKLTDGVEDSAATLGDYVITDRLAQNFDEAVGLIRQAVETRSSKAAYLHGSFGSGKSHFMAVLHALLRDHGSEAARRRDEFAGLMAKHGVWLEGKKFLLVPYHLIGALSLEQRVLGEYVTRVRELHPEAPIPAVHRSDALLEQAASIRARVGDKEFVAGLGGEEDEWGETSSWTSESLDAAFGAAFDDDQRRALVNDLLVSDWGRGFFTNAREDKDSFVSLDHGLTEISRHAKELGYDGLILFLDELILWIANNSGNAEFVAREIQKITNFVEGGDTRRPIPVISFIARQRDLRELIGDTVSGATELGFQDTLNLASGRFDVITLEDRNLPEVARERLLRPKDPDAARQLHAAFEATAKVRREVWDTLLGDDASLGADADAFRATYPFSPVFMATLVHVSSALQRLRSGMRLMRELLVDHRDELRLGDLVPLGDLYDVISKPGDEPFTEKLKAEFGLAQKLYQGQLRPYLLEQHSIGEDDLVTARAGKADAVLSARVRAFTGDDRLIKTLLLSALAPTVPALRNLTARKLAALNHGSIRTPIPGQEATVVSNRLADWSARFSEIQVTAGDDPAVSLQLAGVDVESVINNAREFDDAKRGQRKMLLQRLLWEELGLKLTDSLLGSASLTWRGSARSVELLYGNVRDPRDLSDALFTPDDPAGWRLIIDYPFDDGDHGPADDRQRVTDLAGRLGSTRTVCWVPAAFTTNRLNKDVSRLVIIEAVLQERRFDSAAAHLRPEDRVRAREQLTSLRNSLTSKVKQVLRQAYGLAQKQPDDVVLGFDEHLLTLVTGFRPTLPPGATFADALRSITDQLFARQYPEHPDFDPERTAGVVKPADVKIILDAVRRAVESGDDRVEIDQKPHRAVLKRIAEPLQLGTMGQAVFTLSRHWAQHFQQRAAAATVAIDGELKVTDLRRWIDEPKPLGLDDLLVQLVIAAYAEQSNRSFYLHGGPVAAEPPRIEKAMTLRLQDLPRPDDWAQAKEKSLALFGVTPVGPAVGRIIQIFARDLAEGARRHRDDAYTLKNRLEQHADALGLDRAAAQGRLATARRAADLLDMLTGSAGGVEIIESLARTDLGGPPERLHKSISTARDVAAALGSGPWEELETIRSLPKPYDGEAQAILAQLSAVAADEELTKSLVPALRRAKEDAVALTRRAIVQPPQPDPDPVKPDPTQVSGRRTVAAADVAEVIDQLRTLASQHPDATIDVTWTLQ